MNPVGNRNSVKPQTLFFFFFFSAKVRRKKRSKGKSRPRAATSVALTERLLFRFGAAFPAVAIVCAVSLAAAAAAVLLSLSLSLVLCRHFSFVGRESVALERRRNRAADRKTAPLGCTNRSTKKQPRQAGNISKGCQRAEKKNNQSSSKN